MAAPLRIASDPQATGTCPCVRMNLTAIGRRRRQRRVHCFDQKLRDRWPCASTTYENGPPRWQDDVLTRVIPEMRMYSSRSLAMA